MRAAVVLKEILLLEGTLAAAKQALVDDLALTKDVLQPVAGEAAGQAPTDVDVLNDLLERLEARAAWVLHARQLVKHHAGEVEFLRGQPLQVLIVDNHDVSVASQRRRTLRRRADGQGHPPTRCPLRPLDRPDVQAHAQRRDDEPACSHAVGHHLVDGRERDRRLACAHWRQDHRAVTLVQEVSG